MKDLSGNNFDEICSNLERECCCARVCRARGVSGCFCKGQSPVEMERKWREEKAKTDPLWHNLETSTAQPGLVEIGHSNARKERRNEEKRADRTVPMPEERNVSPQPLYEHFTLIWRSFSSVFLLDCYCMSHAGICESGKETTMKLALEFTEVLRATEGSPIIKVQRACMRACMIKGEWQRACENETGESLHFGTMVV